MGNTVFFSSFTGAEPTERFRCAMQWLREHPNSALVIEPGVYEIGTSRSRETLRNVMSGAYGENPQNVMFSPDFAYDTALDFRGQSGTTVSAYGATLLIDGFMEPVALRNCANITVKGLTIDHKRKPFSMGTVSQTEWADCEQGIGSFTVAFGRDYPLYENSPMPRATLYDPERKRFIAYGQMKVTGRTYLGDQQWRFCFRNLHDTPTGMEWYVWHTFHYRPAILIEEAQNTFLQDVTIHSQPGMGIVGHRSTDIFINNLRVVPSHGTHMSTNTDATHFTSCKGVVSITDSVFEGQGDDSVNIHTYYHTIRTADGCECLTELEAPDGTHTQTADHPDIGDIVELTDMKSLSCKDTYRVLACEVLSPRHNRLLLDKPLPADFADYAFANATQTAKLIFTGNVCRNHIARSVLVKCKHALVENNTITDVTGTAIYVAAESEWFEGLCTTQDIIIRSNRITDCARADGSGRKFGTGGICVTVDADDACQAAHRHIEIIGNSIDCPEAPHAVYVSNTKDLRLEANSTRCAAEAIIHLS